MKFYKYFVLVFASCFLLSCDKNNESEATPVAIVKDSKASLTASNQTENSDSNAQYDAVRNKIIYGNASLADVRLALSQKDQAELTNTMHALYSMRWHRGVFKLLYLMWEGDKSKYPELNWNNISEAPARLALASTLNRIQISDTKIFQDYIRSFKNNEHEFIRAQVVVALGFNGDPEDIPYLINMVKGENDYVAQSAIAGLGLMNNKEAKNALQTLGKLYIDTGRGQIIDGMLRDGYGVIRTNSIIKSEEQGD